jgi:hypothetical protein
MIVKSIYQKCEKNYDNRVRAVDGKLQWCRWREISVARWKVLRILKMANYHGADGGKSVLPD